MAWMELYVRCGTVLLGRTSAGVNSVCAPAILMILYVKITAGAKQQKGVTNNVTCPHRAALASTTTSIDRISAYLT